MRKLVSGVLAFFIVAFLALASSGAASADSGSFTVPDAPSLESPIVDQTGTLTADQQKQLADLIHNDKTAGKRQLAVLMVKTVGSSSIEDASLAVARKWGVGEAGNNNGVLLMVAVDDHKMRIEVGTGLEGALPDIRTKQISDSYITPHFKKSEYFEGVRDGLTQINLAVAGETFAAPASSAPDTGMIILIVFGAVVLVFLVVFLIARRGGGSSGGYSSSSSYYYGSGSSSGSSSSDSFGGGGFDGGGSSSSW